MQRYHGTSCSSAVNNSSIGASARDTTRAESSTITPNVSLNSRRPFPLTPYKLRCDKESLNSRLGPPDFHLQTSNCPEETLTKDYVQTGYRETVEGLEEAREISLSQIQNFTKPLILKCKESIRKCHRAINESRAQKRKAGQVYGVPLSGTLLTKPGIFPEQRACGEEFRKKWIEGLSQQHKRLRSLADHVPHGFRRRSLFEVLIRNEVPLLRATWFIKVTYLNQVRPGSSSLSSGVPDKSQFSRSEQWTKDVIDYLQTLLEEFVSKNNFHSIAHIRDQSPQMVYPGSVQHRNVAASTSTDADEPPLHFKWWYVVRLLQWHHAEGLIIPSLVIDWVFNQLQERESLGILQLLLPVIYGVLEAVVLCQTYVRTLVRIAIRFIQEPSPGGSDLVDNSRRAYTISALVEMLRYLILSVPDTFVALDCFPLPSCLMTHVVNDGNFLLKIAEDGSKTKNVPLDVTCLQRDKGTEVLPDSLSIFRIVSSIQNRAENLARAAKPGHPGQNLAKALQALDKSLTHGDVRVAFKLLFDNLCDGAVDESWFADVSSCLRSSLKYIGSVTLSFISSVFFICEWATCDFRDFRTGPLTGLKFTGRKDFSQVYIAIRILKLKRLEMKSVSQCKNESHLSFDTLAKDPELLNKYPGCISVGSSYESKYITKGGNTKFSRIFESPSPLHDIIVCWMDQHEVQSREGIKRLQLLLMELIRAGIFYPQAYVRQVMVSGIMDRNGVSDLERRKRHHRILKQLPGSFTRCALEEARILEESVLSEVMNIYSNERRLVLKGLLDHPKISDSYGSSRQKQHCNKSGGGTASPSSNEQWKPFQAVSSLASKDDVRGVELEDLKASIAALLQFPTLSTSSDTGLEDFAGSAKRNTSLSGNKMEIGEATLGCEECRRVKRQRLSEDRSAYLPGFPPNALDDEEVWWVRKGPKSLESYKVEPPPKPAKQSGRGRQKVVRKTQSLAQLAAARIEGSQGASTSHVCDNRVNCPHHRTGVEGDASKSADAIRVPCNGDITSIGGILKKMRLVEKRTVMVWLINVAKQQVEEAEKTVTKVGQFGRQYSAVDDRSSVRWKLGEEELSVILYLMDVSDELVSAVRFLLWLLPKVLSSPATSIHGGRNVLMLSRNAENLACEVGEAFLVSSIRRYENVIAAADLVPEILTAAMRRVAATMASTGRVSGSSALGYARYLLKKYGNVVSVVECVKEFKSNYDKRLVSELESGRLPDGEFGFPLGVPAGVEDLDDFFRQKISGVRISRVALAMRDIVQRKFDEVLNSFYGKERKVFGPNAVKSSGLEKLDDGFQTAQQIVVGLMECMRQTGGAAQEGDPTLVSSAISAIVSNVGLVIGKIPDLTAGNHLNFPSTSSSMYFARCILRIHITCLCLLKDALGERQSRVFEVALAAEASSALALVFVPGKAPRSQFQPSPESHDSSSNSSYEALNSSAKTVLGRSAKITGAISALVVGALLQGVTCLERMVTLFRLSEGLDPIQFVRSFKSNSNGNTRSIGALKMDSLVEVSTHWFRVLVGNCRTVSDGFIVDLLGEASVVALSRMQRTLSVNLVFPPAYSIFAFLTWKGFIVNSSFGIRDDIQHFYQSFVLAIGDALKHLPFRDVCLRDTHGLYDLIAADTLDSEFAALLESNGAEMLLKATAFLPLRARLFLDALIDCKMPQHMFKLEDGSGIDGQNDPKKYKEKEAKVVDRLVHVLDTLQPAKFHWQWVELRLLLNEQAVIEKLESDSSLIEAMRSISPNADNVVLSEKENSFVLLILARLLARPDAASLFSEVIHLFGRSLEDSMLMQTKWFLGGNDVLYGRKSIRQRLIAIADSNHLSTKLQFSRPWGWCYSSSGPIKTKGNKRKLEVNSLEEGEVVDEGADIRWTGRGSAQVVDVEGFIVSQQHVAERAFIELILPCVDHGSDEARNTFASDLIKQMNNIEQQINALSRGANKSTGSISSGIESPASKGNSRKGARGGSPGLARRPTGPADNVPPSPGALRASMSLRLQFLLRLLPIMCTDGEPSGKSMRRTLTSVILRLLGSRVVYEDAGLTTCSTLFSSKRDVESLAEASTSSSVVLSGESLFDRLLLLLHGLLSSHRPSWLKLKSSSKSSESGRDFSVFDREVVENLQNDLDRMQLPDPIRWRIQTAMPILLPSVRCSISCQPHPVSSASLAALQSSNTISVLHPSNSILLQRNPVSLARTVTNAIGKPKQLQAQESDMEIDPWILLEDGAGVQSSSNSAVISGSDHANLRALNWLKGAVRVRRTDLTYIGSVDEDS